MSLVLVTGGAGFIGSHTVDRLLKLGHDVRILDNLQKPVHLKGKPAYIPAEAEFMLGDVRDKETIRKALKNVEYVFHLAAYQDYLPDFSTFFHVNSVSTALIYEVAVERHVALRRVIVASSQAVYGEGRYQCPNLACPRSSVERTHFPDIRSEAQLARGAWDHTCPDCGAALRPRLTGGPPVDPRSQRAISKYSQELIALALGSRYDIPTTAARYSITQGPRQSFRNAYSGVCRLFCMSYLAGRP